MFDNDGFIIAFCIILTLAIVFGLCFFEALGDKNKWNDGYCTCGGSWELFDVEHIRNGGDRYYYKCVDCHEIMYLGNHK